MVQALIFDVFGTCVDWRTSVARDVARVLPQVDALEFASAWRAEYQPAMARIREGNRGYIPLDQLHLENLHRVAARFNVSAPDTLNSAWARLDPWPDVVAGLTTLQQGHIIAPCSNGSIALMTRLARYGHLPWDCILGAEIAQDYKPKPIVYLKSCTALGLAPRDVMMVAAHNDDLEAARDARLKTCFVPRLTEHGLHQRSDLTPSDTWDIIAQDFADIAHRITP